MPRNYDGIPYEAIRRQVDPFFVKKRDQLATAYYGPIIDRTNGKPVTLAELEKRGHDITDRRYRFLKHKGWIDGTSRPVWMFNRTWDKLTKKQTEGLRAILEALREMALIEINEDRGKPYDLDRSVWVTVSTGVQTIDANSRRLCNRQELRDESVRILRPARAAAFRVWNEVFGVTDGSMILDEIVSEVPPRWQARIRQRILNTL